MAQRFDKPRQLAGSLVEKLLNVPVCDKESLPSLLSFKNVVNETSTKLLALNIPDLSSYLLFIMTSMCLPLCCQKLFEAENLSEYPTIAQLLSFVKSRIQILENSETTRGSSNRISPAIKSIMNRNQVHKPSRVSLAGVEVNQSKGVTKCPIARVITLSIVVLNLAG